MLWICLHFPYLPLEAFNRLTPADSKATVISEAQQVYCANTAAREAGIRCGQSLNTANALCQPLTVIERDSGKEYRGLEQIAAWCYGVTPMTCISGEDALLLEVASSLKLFHGLASLMHRLSQGITHMGFHYHAGLAATPKAARLLARARAPANTESAAAALTQSKQQLPYLPIIYLDIDTDRIAALYDMGIERLEQLLALPTTAIGKALGQDFLHYLKQVMGETPDPAQPIQPKNHFQSELFYIDGLETSDALLFPMKRLLGELSQFLVHRQLSCRTLHWRLQQYGGKTYPLTLSLSQPQNHSETFFVLTRIKLENLKLHSAVHSITLSAEEFAPAQAQTGDLLERIDSPNRGGSEPSATLLDKLASRLGEENIYRIEECFEGVPEYCWRKTELTSHNLDSKRQNRREQPRKNRKSRRIQEEIRTNPPSALRPTWLLRRPAPLQQQGRQLYWQGARLTLVRGPERIDSHWWLHGVQRDYFIAKQDNGSYYWVFRDLQRNRRWFLHGIFA